jgi:hypothetical protein
MVFLLSLCEPFWLLFPFCMLIENS